ncbi:MAG TPA: twin-arginine translocase subunit TatC [Nitrososphaeraceae archaeon]|jgi:sec-independent protein translocase protein TatC|nr:twin-arginine translocase subunit TatC [Nitrososphaeraceae archaeon]
MSSSGMSVAEHFDELRIRIIHIIICIAVITIFAMSFSIKSTILPIPIPSWDGGPQQNLKIFYPIPDPLNNVALQLTSFMKDTLLPTGVKLIQIAPGQVFFAQVHISLLIGLICSLPIIIKEIFGFISPAFDSSKNKDDFQSEDNIDKKGIKSFSRFGLFKVISPIVLLFILGVVFSYVFVIPFTLNFLYKYGESIGAETFLTVNDFITFVLQFLLGFGIAFQLPVIMYVLSLSGVTDSKFWLRNFRYAIIIISVFGAIITPDGSGVTMWFIALPMIALYAIGIIAIRRREDKVITV